MVLDLLALVFGLVHFSVPLVYYGYLKRCLRRPWNVKVDSGYRPRVTVIVPTYNEASLIEGRLENLKNQGYPRELMEVLVVDSSSDGTADIVEEWCRSKGGMNLKLVKEKKRRGKLHALNTALKHIHSASDVIVFTDADCFWEDGALSKAVSYFADSEIGSVTGGIFYTGSEIGLGEDMYRNYYNVLRIAESKRHSTPVHNGPLLAIRGEILRKVGLPNYPGSDDSAFGSFIAFMGYRAIQVDDAIVREPIRGNQFRRKTRRAQHLLLNFLRIKRYSKKMGLYTRSWSFEKIWKMEWWLHVANPWLLVSSVTLLVVSVVLSGSIIALALLGTGSLFLALKMYRTWILQQVYLVVAAVRNLWIKEEMWSR